MKYDWETMKNEYRNNFEFRSWFKENFINIITENDEVNPYDIAGFCIFNEGREVFFKNLKLVLSKMKCKSDFLPFMRSNEIRNNIDIFFEGEKTDKDMKKCFHKLIDAGFLNSDKGLEILSNKIETIYDGIGFQGVCEIMDMIPHFYIYSENNPYIKKIDNFLTGKFEEICSTNFENYGFKFQYFNKMNNFKKEIQKKGPDFFIGFSLDSNISLEECRDVAKSIFGEFTSENFSKIKYGQNDARKALIIQTIIDELLEQTGEGASMDDVKKIGQGVYSTTYKVGNYALKIGIGRNNYTIPNHRRILKPIIRTKIKSDFSQEKFTNDADTFIEVQNLIETSWCEHMTEEEINQVLFDIYSELRNDGLIWVDVKPDNIGKLLKPNTSHIFYLDIDGRKKEINPDGNSTGVLGEEKGELLDVGDYVIIDSDYILEYDDWLKIQKIEHGEVCREKKFEARYQAELSRKQGESIKE